MYELDVHAADDLTLIFTRTERAQTPWGSGNTTLLVPPDQLAPLIAKLQRRLHELPQPQPAAPIYVVAQAVISTGHFRPGQAGRVVEVRAKTDHVREVSGEAWTYTVAFADGTTWSYRVGELARPT